MLLLKSYEIGSVASPSAIVNLNNIIDDDESTKIDVSLDTLQVNCDLSTIESVGCIRIKTNSASVLSQLVASTSIDDINYTEYARININEKAWHIAHWENQDARYLRLEFSKTESGSWEFFEVQAYNRLAGLEDPWDYNIENVRRQQSRRRADGSYVPNYPNADKASHNFQFQRLPKAQLDLLLLQRECLVIPSEFIEPETLLVGEFDARKTYKLSTKYFHGGFDVDCLFQESGPTQLV